MVLPFPQTEQALDLLRKAEDIRGPKLNLGDKYLQLINIYSQELENIRRLYQKQKNDPMIPRNFPPIAGKIAWARQLYQRIERPMKVLQKKTDILKVT